MPSSASLAPFAIPGTVTFSEGRGGLPLMTVTNDFARGEIYLHGAHVTSFVPAGGTDLLWTSPSSPFEVGKPIRGGIPLCFPWFSAHRTRKDFPMHGFLRIRNATPVETARLSDGRTKVVLGFSSDEETRAMWPHEFHAELAVTVGRTLELALMVTNTGSTPLSYESCFHTYLAVGEVAASLVRGFDGVAYLDRGRADARAIQNGDLTLGTETTHIHTHAPASCEVLDGTAGRTIIAAQQGLAETVVWNPGEAAAAKNPEMAGHWRGFVCVEGANCMDTSIILLPGTSHRSVVAYGLERSEAAAK